MSDAAWSMGQPPLASSCGDWRQRVAAHLEHHMPSAACGQCLLEMGTRASRRLFLMPCLSQMDPDVWHGRNSCANCALCTRMGLCFVHSARPGSARDLRPCQLPCPGMHALCWKQLICVCAILLVQACRPPAGSSLMAAATAAWRRTSAAGVPAGAQASMGSWVRAPGRGAPRALLRRGGLHLVHVARARACVCVCVRVYVYVHVNMQHVKVWCTKLRYVCLYVCLCVCATCSKGLLQGWGCAWLECLCVGMLDLLGASPQVACSRCGMF